MPKHDPLNILKVQSESSKISNLGQTFMFTENCTPTIVQINIFEEPQNVFSQPKSQTQTIEPAPCVLTVEYPWVPC